MRADDDQLYGQLAVAVQFLYLILHVLGMFIQFLFLIFLKIQFLLSKFLFHFLLCIYLKSSHLFVHFNFYEVLQRVSKV